MTKDGSFKKVVRRHAEATGQRYTRALTDLEGLRARLFHQPVGERLVTHLRDHYGVDAVAATKVSAAIDTHGTLYVATTTGKVIAYVNGATTPSYVLSDSAVTFIYNVAVDSIGNLIVTYHGPATGPGARVGAFPAFTSLGDTVGTRAFEPLSVDAPTGANPSPEADGVAIDKYGDLLVDDQIFPDVNIGVYRPATQAPAFFIGAATRGGGAVFALTGPDNHHLFAAPVFGDVLYKFAYPSGNLQEQIPLGFGNLGLVTAVATYPAPPVGTW